VRWAVGGGWWSKWADGVVDRWAVIGRVSCIITEQFLNFGIYCRRVSSKHPHKYGEKTTTPTNS